MSAEYLSAQGLGLMLALTPGLIFDGSELAARRPPICSTVMSASEEGRDGNSERLVPPHDSLRQLQVPPPPEDQPRRIDLEVVLRVGPTWFGDHYNVTGSVGGRYGFYPWTGAVAGRLAIHVHGDYAQLSRAEGTIAGLEGLTRTTLNWFTVAPMLGFDILRTSRVVLDVRAGGALDVMIARFALEGDDDDDDSPDGFVGVCDLRAFTDRCDSETRFTGAAAVGVRFWPRASGALVLGAEYSANFLERRQIVGTIGFRFTDRRR